MKRSIIPSLDDLRAFDAVSRLGSMRAAANELALTHGAVSRRISKLSDALGFDLFEKSGRGIRLTQSGEKLSKTVGESLAKIALTIESLQYDRGHKAVVLSCERSVAVKWLIPLMRDFQAKAPEINVHLSVGGGALNFENQGPDIALRRLDFPLDPSWHVEKLFKEAVGPVMRPDLVASFLKGTFTGLATRTRLEAWTNWDSRFSHLHQDMDFMEFDHHFLMVQAAISGLGVALAPKILVLDELNSGQLEAPFGFSTDGSSYGLVMRTGAHHSVEVDRLKQWIMDQVSISNLG